MTLNKKKYFRQKSKAVYTLILFYFKVIKHVINIFFYFHKINKNNLKKQVATMQPISTFTSKGSKAIFNSKIFEAYELPFGLKVGSGCIIATCFFKFFDC
jgi:hypothetical protein